MKKDSKKLRMLLHKGIMICTFFAMIFLISSSTSTQAYQFKFSEFDWDSFYETKKGFWESSCEDGHGNVDKNCEFTIMKAQKKFYTKFYKTLAKYEKKGVFIPGTKEYEYVDDIILETVFYELNPSQFSDTGEEYISEYNPNSGEGIYSIDESDLEDPEVDIDYNDEKVLTYFENETDTIKTLVQNLVAYTTDCYGVYGNPTYMTAQDGNKYATCSSGSLITLPKRGEKCVDKISNNSLGFWKYFISKVQYDETLPWLERGAAVLFLGRNTSDENYVTCKSFDSSYSEKTMYVYNDDAKLNIDRYFDFLSYNTYFDSKAHLQYKFRETILEPAGVDCMTKNVCDNSLEALGSDTYEYYEGEAILVRREIIEDIIDILNNYGFDIEYSAINGNEYNVVEEQTAARKSFYWPIGSDETEERNGVIYADKEPASTDVISNFGTRENPVTGEIEEHYGIDISGVNEVTNVIAVYRGEVISVINNCVAGDYTCNEGYGNAIIIAHPNNDYTIYAHLASIDENITVGVSVDKGELIGILGQTGSTNTPCLHFEIRKGSNDIIHAINPLGELDINNPRPTVPSGDFSVHETSLSKEEFASKVRAYCLTNSCSSTFMNVFVSNIESIYDVSINANVNPELVIIRGSKEGMSPGGSTNNYWGIGCTNGSGVGACHRYSSLTEGVKGFANVVSQYETVSQMMGRYAYIGAVWYNPGSWSLGGCKYLPYISKYMSASRASYVEGVCSSSKTCETKGQTSCTPTTQEDQDAYAMYNASSMVNMRYVMFGL